MNQVLGVLEMNQAVGNYLKKQNWRISTKGLTMRRLKIKAVKREVRMGLNLSQVTC
jgi:hypothetical protein